MTTQSHVPSGKEPQTILVVDDDPSMLVLCSTKLEKAGFKVLQATGSSEALKIGSEHQGMIDLLLSDLLLPPQGFSLASANNKFPRVHGHLLVERFLEMKKDARILLMSALSDQELRDRDILVGNFPFIRKPFTMETLLEKVQEALGAAPPAMGRKGSKEPPAEEKDIHWYD